MCQVLVVGAGPSGCTLARSFAESGKSVAVIESRDHIGGNCYDYVNEYGIRVHKYGPHFFHTKSKFIWDYVNRFGEFFEYKNRVNSKISDLLVPVPINIDTVNKLFGTDIQDEIDMKTWLNRVRTEYSPPTNSKEAALNTCGHSLYSLIFRGYTRKQWGMDASELEPSVLQRIPIYTTKCQDYFTDQYQGLPKDGYTKLFENMLNHPNITLEKGVDYFNIKHAVNPEVTVYTGRIDTYYQSSGLEPLEYRSLKFETENLEQDFFQNTVVVNYPDERIPYTRTVEYKHIPFHTVDNNRYTTVVKEFPTSIGDPYYPIPNKRNRDLYEKYKLLSENEPGIIFSGRLANYKYYNMDQAIEASLEIATRHIHNK